MNLYHYTCTHGRVAIGDRGVVMPIADHAPDAVHRCPEDWRWLTYLCWFTDLYPPDRLSLGLTMDTVACDRTVHRYRATDTRSLVRWLDTRATWPPTARVLNSAGLPGRWWVSYLPVPVELVP